MAKILIVDDDPLIIRMYQTALSFQGFDVDSVENGAKGFEKIKKTKYDLIIFDVMMPEMNGLELLTAIKVDPKNKDIPTIALTNLAGTQDVEEVVKLGVSKYIIKSESKPNDIVNVVKQLLNQQVGENKQ
jgi:two-component system sensor histidine kinase ChiS